MNILVVDDEKLNLLVAQSYINSILDKCNVILCNSPFEVIGILEKNEIDIVLLDIIMPDVSGIDVLQNIRSKKELSHIQVIMLTSLVDKKSFKKCFELGANDYILKPIEITEFSARLKAAIKSSASIKVLKEAFEQIKIQNIELKELNRKLEDTQFHMIQKEKLASIGELAAGVAHEINNPIGFIGSNLETMQNFINKVINIVSCYKEFVNNVKPFSEEITELKEQIKSLEDTERKVKLDFIINEFSQTIEDSKEGVERISKIVQSLKGFARTGHEDEKTCNDLRFIIEEALLIIQNEAKYSIDIKTYYSEIPEILCNKGQIGQVVLNILINAVQAIKSQERDDRGSIIIETCMEDNVVCCHITDDGPGIKNEVIEKIFDPFFTTKDIGKGTGLGLSISYDIIVKKHNGEFYVKNEEGKGATFTFKLPLNK